MSDHHANPIPVKLTPKQRERAARLYAGCVNDPEAAAFEIIALRDAGVAALRGRDEAVMLLRDILPAALARAPKRIKNRECFTLNLARAFLSRLSAGGVR